MKKSLLFFLFIITGIIYAVKTNAQALYYGMPTYAIHISNPLSFFYKIGGKVEYRIKSENAIALDYNQYTQYFKGYQVGLEYRIYFPGMTVHENLVYIKAGHGYAGYEKSSYYSPADDKNDAPGTYYYAGGGVGKHYNFWGACFLEIAAGIKYSYIPRPPSLYNERAFYLVGPGSIPDVHIHFGVQF